MTNAEIKQHYADYRASPTPDNLDTLLAGVYEVAKQQLKFHNLGIAEDDIAQDVVLRVMSSLNNRADSPFDYWLLRVIFNARMNHYNSQTRLKEEEFVESVFEVHEPEYTFAHTRLKETAGEHWDIFQELLNGDSFDEVAARRGITKRAVQQRLYRIRQKQANIYVN